MKMNIAMVENWNKNAGQNYVYTLKLKNKDNK